MLTFNLWLLPDGEDASFCPDQSALLGHGDADVPVGMTTQSCASSFWVGVACASCPRLGGIVTRPGCRTQRFWFHLVLRSHRLKPSRHGNATSMFPRRSQPKRLVNISSPLASPPSYLRASCCPRLSWDKHGRRKMRTHSGVRGQGSGSFLIIKPLMASVGVWILQAFLT